MAKKKKHYTTKRHAPRRRRVGAASHHGLMNDAMEVGGLVAGSLLATMVQRHATSMNPKLISAGEIAVGYYLKTHSTHPAMRGLGWGMLGAGAIGLTHEVGLIHGLDDMVSGLYSGGMTESINMPAGLNNSSYVNGISNSNRIAGDALNMDRDNVPPIGY